MTISPNRLVAIGTPFIFAPLAGAVTALAAKYAPGVQIEEGQLQAIFIAGATIAVAKAGIWMKGWQDYEKRQELLPSDALELANDIPSLVAGTETDVGEPAEIAGSAGAETELDVGDADVEEYDFDDLLAEIEAAQAEAAPAART